MTQVHIGARAVGRGHRCFIIAEAGVNHNGDIALARELVLAARDAGADCVKFQTFRAEQVATRSAPKADYQLRSTDAAESQLEMLQRLELRAEAFEELHDLCRTAGIAFLSTPYSEEDVDLLERIEVPAYKVPSALLPEPAFLRRVASTGKPVLLSTGMATLDEVDQALAVLRGSGGPPVVLLQCTTDYPAAIDEANLRTIPAMEARFNVPVGYSDHTTTHVASLAAVALGACVIEKHFTLDRTLPGPDHASSANPDEFAALVGGIRAVEAALGSGQKVPSPRERRNAVGMRRSLVARITIEPGTLITAAMLICKRPATGIAPQDESRVIGRRARVRIEADAQIDWSMLE